MKIWISDTQTQTYRNVKIHAGEHSDFIYRGDFDDEELKTYLLEVQEDIDIEKNIKLLKYYGYLHLFIINKK